MKTAKPILYWAVVIEGQITGLFAARSKARRNAKLNFGRVARVRISEVRSRD